MQKDKKIRMAKEIERMREGLPEIFQNLGLSKPTEDLDEVLDRLGLNPQSLTEGSRSAESSLDELLWVTVAFDATEKDAEYSVTLKTWRLLEEAKNNGGLNGLNQAMRSLHETLQTDPFSFKNRVNDAYRKLRQ